MKTKTTITLLCLFQISTLSAQIPTTQWDARFGGSDLDFLYSVEQTTDGGYILGGESVSTISGDKTQSPQGFFDFWIVKTDADGIKQWDATFGGSSDEHLRSLIQTADGGYLLGGHSISSISGDKTQGLQGGYDYWIVKTDVNGIKQWDYRYGGDDTDWLFSMDRTSDGGYILGGSSHSGKNGDKSEGKRGLSDYWILKIDVNGLKQWDARFGGSDYDNLNVVLQTEDGGYLLGGYSLSGISGDKTQDSYGLNDYWIVKTNVNGIKQWDARFGGSNDDCLYAVQQTTDGGYILGGYSISGISGDKSQASQGSGDYWIVKTDASGVKQWDAGFGGEKFDGLTDLQQSVDGGFILCGQSDSYISGDKTAKRKGKNDYWIIKTDSNGIKLWDVVYGGTDQDIPQALEQTVDGGFIMGGYSNSGIGGDKTQASQGSTDYWVVKVALETPTTCSIPIGEFTSAITATSATTNWNTVAAANKYKVQYRIEGTNNWIKVSATFNLKKIQELFPATQYEWQVKSICNDLGLGNSDWSTIQNFVTLPEKLSDHHSISPEMISIYPNPFYSSTTIQLFFTENSAVEIALLDLQGRKIKTIAEGNFSAGVHQLSLQKENLGAGIYLLHAEGDRINFNRKVIIE